MLDGDRDDPWIGVRPDPRVHVARRERVAGKDERGDRPQQPEAGARAHAATRTVTAGPASPSALRRYDVVAAIRTRRANVPSAVGATRAT